MTSFYEEFKDKKTSELNNALIEACLNEDISVIRYLVSHIPGLINRPDP